MVRINSRECLWICGRGPTRLQCRLCQHHDDDIEVEVTRNDRLYGTYRFTERLTALTFAERLRHNFEGNGWIPATT